MSKSSLVRSFAIAAALSAQAFAFLSYAPEPRLGGHAIVDHTYGFTSNLYGIEWDTPESDSLFNLAWRVGAPFIRLNFYRHRIQITPDSFFWNVVDKQVKKAKLRGLKLAPVIALGNNINGPWWGAKDTGVREGRDASYSEPPSDLEDQWSDEYGYSRGLYDFYKALLQRYPGEFPYITMGNEPNAVTYWGGSADEYIRCLKTAKLAVDRYGEGTKLIDGGIASEMWGIVFARQALLTGIAPDSVIIHHFREYYKTTQRSARMDTVTDAQLMEQLLHSPESIYYSAFVDSIFQGVVGSVDVANFHFYEDVRYLPMLVRMIRQKYADFGWPDPPLCTNELGVKHYADTTFDEAGQQHADELLAKLNTARELGLEYIGWYCVSYGPARIDGVKSIHDSLGHPYEAQFAYTDYLWEIHNREQGK